MNETWSGPDHRAGEPANKLTSDRVPAAWPQRVPPLDTLRAAILGWTYFVRQHAAGWCAWDSQQPQETLLGVM